MHSTVKAMCFRAYENITTKEQNEKFIRQPALRIFAAELAESKQTIIENIEGRDFDSRYQLSPTGFKVKRVLMMGALVEVDNIGTSGEYLRGRIIDPTGAFTVYAGQYQPEALLSLSSLNVPCFVAVVGKTNVYRPDEKTTIVSIRPETIVQIDAATRDHWIKETVARTLERVQKSQLPEAEKEKFRQLCKDALTKLVNMPQEINIPDIQNNEKPLPALPETTSKKHTELKSVTSKDSLLTGNIKDEEPADRILITSQVSVVEEQPKPETEFYEILNVQESKESRAKRNNPVKRQKKKKIERGTANNNQKTLFTEISGQE